MGFEIDKYSQRTEVSCDVSLYVKGIIGQVIQDRARILSFNSQPTRVAVSYHFLDRGNFQEYGLNTSDAHPDDISKSLASLIANSPVTAQLESRLVVLRLVQRSPENSSGIHDFYVDVKKKRRV